jgi:hypothetical protein
MATAPSRLAASTLGTGLGWVGSPEVWARTGPAITNSARSTDAREIENVIGTGQVEFT